MEELESDDNGDKVGDDDEEMVQVGADVEDIEAERMRFDDEVLEELEAECEEEDDEAEENGDDGDDDGDEDNGPSSKRSKLEPLTMQQRQTACILLNKVSPHIRLFPNILNT